MYDSLGNLIQRQESNASASLTENFTYDADNRVTSSQLVNGSTTSTNLEVSYNPDGSIAQKMETGGTDTPTAYAPQWTSYNCPRSISATLASGQTESATFDYGPDRQRWRMVYTEDSASETTEYIGRQMEKVSSSIGTQYRYYIQGADGLAAIVASTGSGTPTVDYVLEDQEGSIAALLNSTGATAANESFTAYGNRQEASTWSGVPSPTEEGIMDGITRQGFTGQTVLGQMGLNHMNGRVEDAVTGTFLSSDPRINDPYNMQDYNRYAYVYNNPLTNFDPTGFDDAPAPPQVPWPGPGIDVTACGPGSTTFTVGGSTSCAPAPDFAPVPPIGSWGSGVTFSGTGIGGQSQQQQEKRSNQSPLCNKLLPDGSTTNQNVNYLRQMEGMLQLAGSKMPYLAPFYTWLTDVAPGGAWDYKLSGQPGSEDMGNFNFAATGNIFFGPSPLTLRSGAGAVQLLTHPQGSSGGIPFLLAPYGDAINDQQAITAGINGGCG